MPATRETGFDMDMTKLMGAFKVPEVDLEALMDGQRKNVEAWSAAQKCCVEGAQKLFEYQVGAMQKAADDFNTSLKAITGAPNAQERLDRQGELVEKAIERAFGQTREVTEMVVRSNMDAVAPLNKRLVEGLDEIGRMFRKTAAPKA